MEADVELKRTQDNRAWFLKVGDEVIFLESTSVGVRCPECGYVGCRCEDW